MTPLAGELKWSAGQGMHSYSSPQLATIGGVEQVLMESDRGVEAFDPATGKLLWEHEWYLQGMFRVCQPLVVEGQHVLIGTGMGNGTRLVSVTKDGDAWTVDRGAGRARTSSPTSMTSSSGTATYTASTATSSSASTWPPASDMWKKGRYGNGQVLLVGDDGLMIIISETGDAVLALGTPKDLAERGRMPP